MSRRLALLGLAATLLSPVGCSKDEATSSSPANPVLTALPSTVTADGRSTTTITITAGAAPFSLLTSRGTFSNGARSITVQAVNGFAVLSPCDARLDATCAGPTVVTAAGADGGTGQIQLQFQGFEDCSNGLDDNGDGLKDCADPQCALDSPCGPNGLVCSSTQQCNKCTVAGGGALDPSGETHCTDGVDNDCDGRIDCADANCADQICRTSTGSTGVCDAGACVCDKAEDAESSCGDGKDNDCDTRVDCADPDCLGDLCDAAKGLVCSGGATPACVVCPTGQASESASQCGDGKDNDCDGAVDCFDTDCQPVGATPGKQCNPFGGICRLTQGVPSCGCPSGATTETSCSDGVDNDCDGGSDCGDTDCQPATSGLAGPSCGQSGRACTSEGACACPTGTTELCDNYDASGAPIDDDCDGRANCADRDCRPATPGGAGEDCSDPDQVGMACDATGACACTGNGGTPEGRETTCDDGFDNDCDFLVDCQDPDCGGAPGRPCGPAGARCQGTPAVCACPGGATESSCSDGLDNDCDGKIDCEETSCANLACSAASPAYRCLSGVCSDPVTQYGVAVVPVRARIPADGKATTAVSVAVTLKGAPAPSQQVTLALSDAALGTLGATSVTTDSQGRASVTFRSSGPVGVETITATVTGVGATGTATIAMPAIGEIRLREGGILFPVMGVRTSGFQEQNQLTVEILDTEQRAYPDGLDVVFEHRPLGGSTLSDPLPPASASCAATPCLQSVVQTVPGGTANVRLYSGTVAGVVRLSATATAGGVTRLFELPSIAIVGAKPNAGHFSVICGPENVPAYAGSTCHVSTIDAPFTCVALLKDRYNNALGRATTVSFMSEAGAVGPPAVTPEYDPSQAPSDQPDLGHAVELVSTLGAKLPKDVAANAGEQAIAIAPDVCGVTQRSPRDGVVTVVAWTAGEEAFFDANGNGQYDPGEPFVDLPEPFVDYDDDDGRDGDEPFVDSNGNGLFDGPNGAWDASANVWTKTVVVYSGMPAFLRTGVLAAARDLETRWMETGDAASYAAPTPVARFDVRPEFPPDPFVDCNDNQRRDTALAEPFTDANLSGAYDPPETYTDTNGNGVHDAGEPFVDANANGEYDVGEPFDDCNGNGVRELLVSEPYQDVNGNGAFDAFGSSATSEALVVGASDRNLNRLAEATTYSVTKPQDAKFKVSYDGLAGIPDRRGLGFGFQPCLATAPTTCALDCADVSSPASPRCVMRTRVADFTYGYTATVTFTGGSPGDFDGATQAFWNAELFGERLVVPVGGTHQ